MKKHATRAALGALALAGAAACTDLPTAVPAPTDTELARAFAVAPMAPITPTALVADPIVNGSFETGDFTGWTASPMGPSPQWSVGVPGQGGAAGMAVTAPQDGGFVAWNGFNGGGPTTFILYQDVVLPGNDVEISWQYRAQWTSDYPDNQPRTADVQVRDPGTGAVLATLHGFSTGLADVSPTGDTGWLTVTVPFTGVAGQVVRLQVTQFVGDFFPGPGQFEVDAFTMVSLDPEPPPVDPPGTDPEVRGDCMTGGWETFGFENQGQCIRFVETGKDNR